MMARGHLASGLMAGLATAPLLTHDVLSGAMFVSVVTGSTLLPDIDSASSTITKSLGPVTKTLSWLLRLVTEHRGFTHRDVGIVLWLLLFAGACAWSGVPVWVAVASAIGCAVHVLGDGLTTMGVHPFVMFPKVKLRLTDMKAGAWPERYIFVPLFFAASLVFLWFIIF